MAQHLHQNEIGFPFRKAYLIFYFRLFLTITVSIPFRPWIRKTPTAYATPSQNRMRMVATWARVACPPRFSVLSPIPVMSAVGNPLRHSTDSSVGPPGSSIALHRRAARLTIEDHRNHPAGTEDSLRSAAHQALLRHISTASTYQSSFLS